MGTIAKKIKNVCETKLISEYLTQLEPFMESIKYHENSEEILSKISSALKYEYLEDKKLLFQTGNQVV